MASKPMFRHAGELSWQDFPKLAARLRERLASEQLNSSQRQKAFSVFVEVTYNVLHYAKPARREAGSSEQARQVFAEIALGMEGSAVWIQAANLVTTRQAADLEERLATLRALSSEQARALYRDQLTRGEGGSRSADSKGGGLGLLTVAREACRPLDYTIFPTASGDAAWFRLKVFI